MSLPAFFLGALLLSVSALGFLAPIKIECPNCAGEGSADIETNATWEADFPDDLNPRKPKGISGMSVPCSRCRTTGRIPLADRLLHFGWSPAD